MCDYSLEQVQNRPARAGEKLVTQRFKFGSLGFAAPGDRGVAVCVQPDTKLTLTDIPVAIQEKWRVGPVEEVTFVRLDDGPYHDGVMFTNGARITLQELWTDVWAIVEPTWSKGGWNSEKPGAPSRETIRQLDFAL